MRKNTSTPFYSLFWIILLVLGLYGCANMRAPEGGPVDKTPPKVLKMEPSDLTTNFSATKVVITFDEYFNIQNEQKEFSISPEQEKPPLLKKNQKRLEIIFQDSLEKNTTYTLNFGKAIVDVNEGNILQNLTYAFSTGPLLDSLSISGQVINTQSGKPEFDATVFIFPLERDTLFGKSKPAIFTSTDSSGNYSLKHLKKGVYKIYALKETSPDRIYQQANDEVAFLKDTLVLEKDLRDIDLALFKERPDKFRILDKKINSDGSLQVLFNQQLKTPDFRVIDNKEVEESKILRFNKTNDSLKVWLKNLSFDSIKVEISDAGKILDTLRFDRDKKDTYTRTLQLSDNLEAGVLNPYRPLKLYANFPIEKVDPTKIKLKEDTIFRTNFTLRKDTSDLLAYYITYPWRKKTDYTLTIGENTFTAIFDTKNKEIVKKFTLGANDDYGTYVLNVQLPDSVNAYILEILNEKKSTIARYPLTKNTNITLANYKVGSYYTRIIYDDNKNGQWDTGNLKLKTQPESTWTNPQEIVIRANWTQNMTFTVPSKAEAAKTKPVQDNVHVGQPTFNNNTPKTDMKQPANTSIPLPPNQRPGQVKAPVKLPVKQVQIP